MRADAKVEKTYVMIRITLREKEILQGLADDTDRSLSGLVRWLIKTHPNGLLKATLDEISGELPEEPQAESEAHP